ncbi:MAG: hypothetical protein ACKVS8_01440 [Phycisphaerales bacterium]
MAAPPAFHPSAAPLIGEGARSPPSGPWAVLGWAAYLACSWTWCIGMFLPVLLVRDFGLWGFVVFAVPNVIGAAAMGWVLSRSGAEAIRLHHAAAVRAFSVVTAMFQAFFFAWIFARVGVEQRAAVPTSPLVPAIAFIPLCIIPVLLISGPDIRPRRAAAAVLLVISAIVIFGGFWPKGALDLPTPLLPPEHIPALALVCLFGFGLCPYLDATFLRTRTAVANTPSRAAFGIGFLLLFAAMIVGTLLYTPALLSRGPWWFDNALPTQLGLLTALHFAPQLFFTSQAHARESTVPGQWFAPIWFWLPAALAVGGGMLLFALEPTGVQAGGEFIYRLFMSFYGLVFPAYVWVCVIPRRSRGSGDRPAARAAIAPPTRGSLVVCALAVALASPCYWLGFIERQTWWLVPGVAIVLLARLCAPRPVRAFERSPSLGDS